MDRRWFLVPLVVLLGVIGYFAVSEPSRPPRLRPTPGPSAAPVHHEEPHRPPQLVSVPTTSLPVELPPRVLALPAVTDRKLRAELRSHLMAARSDPDAGIDALDPGFVQERLHVDLVPLADGCQKTARRPGQSGAIVLRITLAGLAGEGTLVDAADLVKGATTLDDREIVACFRDALFATVMTPPARSGSTTLTYAFTVPSDPRAP